MIANRAVGLRKRGWRTSAAWLALECARLQRTLWWVALPRRVSWTSANHSGVKAWCVSPWLCVNCPGMEAQSVSFLVCLQSLAYVGRLASDFMVVGTALWISPLMGICKMFRESTGAFPLMSVCRSHVLGVSFSERLQILASGCEAFFGHLQILLFVCLASQL
jgi:hypothetical protein